VNRAILAGLLLGLAWLVPGSVLCAILGWISCLLFVYSAHDYSKNSIRNCYIGGIVAIGIAFYWICGTITRFGGFPWIGALPVYLLFVSVTAVSFGMYAYLVKRFDKILLPFSLSTAFSWITVETFVQAIFPWYFGHTQLAFKWIAQISDLAGAHLISLLMFWVCEAIYRYRCEVKLKRVFILPVFLTLCALTYGKEKIADLRKAPGEHLNIAVIQANLSTEQKRNIEFFKDNLDRYIDLSKNIIVPSTLIVWPESVVTEPIDASLKNIFHDPRFENFPKSSPMMVGGLTFESQERYFNSALGILSDGTILPTYNKRILMPFGEFTPLGNYLPWLKALNDTAGNFTAGKDDAVFDFGTDLSGAKLSPLICYEDIVPEMARSSTLKGAEVLVNLTNDAWFGNTAALYQHHLIASFRAIENRRYLIRSTNSGLTAVVNHFGETVSTIPPFTEGTLLAKVERLRYMTYYTKYVGEFPFIIIGLCMLGVVILSLVKERLT